MCGSAAVYFPTFDGDLMGHRLLGVLTDPQLAEQLGAVGQQRSEHFSWNKHFDQLLEAIDSVLSPISTAAQPLLVGHTPD
jgi:glycosyltransferase involved in cell wall biosynthesis